MIKNILIAVAIAIGLYVLTLFSQIAGNMDKMAESMNQMTIHVSVMQESLEQMQKNVARIDKNMETGSQQIEQINPMNMIQNMAPGTQRQSPSSNGYSRFRPR